MRPLISIVVILITLWITACSPKYFSVENTKEKRIFITDSLRANPEISHLITPYKLQMVDELDRVLSYAPMDLQLKGKNSALGNMVADIMLDYGNDLYATKHAGRKIDVALMNKGGLRRSFTAGDLSVRSIYELMPFENEVVVVEMSGATFYKMVEYLRKSDRNHPIAGMKFLKNSADKNFYVGTQPFDENKNYLVLTNDYIQKGGDGMQFFKEAKQVEYLNIKLRDMFIQHLDKVDTIQINMEPRYLD